MWRLRQVLCLHTPTFLARYATWVLSRCCCCCCCCCFFCYCWLCNTTHLGKLHPLHAHIKTFELICNVAAAIGLSIPAPLEARLPPSVHLCPHSGGLWGPGLVEGSVVENQRVAARLDFDHGHGIEVIFKCLAAELKIADDGSRLAWFRARRRQHASFPAMTNGDCASGPCMCSGEGLACVSQIRRLTLHGPESLPVLLLWRKRTVKDIGPARSAH
jgi:hypothetical protein